MEIVIVVGAFTFGMLFTYFIYHLKFGAIADYQKRVLQETSLAQDKLVQEASFAIREKELQVKSDLKIEEETRKFKLQKQLNDATEKLKKVEKKEQQLNEQERELKKALELLNLSEEAIKEELFKKHEKEVLSQAANTFKRIESEALESSEKRAQEILETAIQRFSLPQLNSIVTSGVPIDDEDIKGKVVGKEGRNIRTFEELTGTTLLMDDSPHSILISCFDPIRREIASKALRILVAEGKIYPSRIEEVVRAMQMKVEEIICQKGEAGAAKAQVFGLHPELIKLLGKLHFRYSLGQNLLEHSIEVSHLLGLIAEEMGLNGSLARRIGLLHDIGKAIDSSKGKSHAIIGMEFAKSCGEREAVYNGIGCHHFEVESKTLEGALCHIADALSASRPGGRQERLDTYLQRMQEVEKIAEGLEGVEKVYALQMGKEIRVIVHPDWNKEPELKSIACSVKEKILSLNPTVGKVKLTLCCETKMIEMI